jgi:hypothetical protein
LKEKTNKNNTGDDQEKSKLPSSERKKLKNELDETHKKVSEVFIKVRKQMDSKPVKHNQDDVKELKTRKTEERELLNKLIPEYNVYNVYGTPT